MEHSIDEFVRSIIVAASDSPELNLLPETLLVDINMDSLALASVITQVEAVRQLELEPEQLERIFTSTTVRDVVAAVGEALKAKS